MLVCVDYPSGGFGHFIAALLSRSFDSVFDRGGEFLLDSKGTSHQYPLHYSKWRHRDPSFELQPKFDFGDKHSVLLVDSGFDNSSDVIFSKIEAPFIIRLCIDDRAKSIVHQTCKIKAENSLFNLNGNDWEERELFTLTYHHIDNNHDYYLNTFSPGSDFFEINISDLFFNFESVKHRLAEVFGQPNNNIDLMHQQMVQSNIDFIKAEKLVNSFEQSKPINWNEYSIHEQGFFNYWIEKTHNIEIPVFDYKDWFSSYEDVHELLTKYNTL